MRRIVTTTACIVFLFLMFGSLQPVYSQNFPTVEERVADIDKAVGLTSEQKEKLTKHFEEQMERFQEMRERMRQERGNDQGDSPQRGNRSEGRQGGPVGGFFGMGTRISPEIQEILTEEQLEKYTAYMREQNLERRVNMYDRMLDLTDNQKDGIRTILTNMEKEIEDMTPSEDMSRSERRKLNGKMDEVREKYNEEIKKLLTGDQVTAFEEMQERMRSRGRNRG